MWLELPWECPEIAAPADAEPYDHDAGVGVLIDELEARVEVWWDEACAWSSTTDEVGTVTETCVTAAGAMLTSTRLEGVDTSDGYGIVHAAWSRTVEPPTGAETWTSLTVSGTTIDERESRQDERGAVWAGSIDGMPDDGFLDGYERETSGSDGLTWSGAYATPGCRWSAATDAYGDDRAIGDHRVHVSYYAQCGVGSDVQATLDGEDPVAVDWTTWAIVEADHDGWSAAGGDCDDTDPTIAPCAHETAHDGVDQDCDGADPARTSRAAAARAPPRRSSRSWRS